MIPRRTAPPAAQADEALITTVKVTDNPIDRRYEAWLDGNLAGFAEYARKPTRITFVHTQVNPAYEGHGIGTALVRASLDAARAHGLTVRAVCPFYAAWIKRHPEYQDLLTRR
ncbi:GNAT family N-acetyltransferase [Actinomadura sp. 9N407]|uniref:GNAT family N-acetyltransferase n=1 Tax=Actinomadura sp. 9N407 TaxID=3375154 RepID=UPI003799D701